MVLRNLEINKVYKIAYNEPSEEFDEVLFILDNYKSNHIYTGRLIYKSTGHVVKEVKLNKNIESYLSRVIGHKFELFKMEGNYSDEYEIGDIYRTPVTEQMFKMEVPVSVNTNIHFIDIFLDDKYKVYLCCRDSELNILSEFEIDYQFEFESVEQYLEEMVDEESKEIRREQVTSEYFLILSYKDNTYREYLSKIIY